MTSVLWAERQHADQHRIVVQAVIEGRGVMHPAQGAIGILRRLPQGPRDRGAPIHGDGLRRAGEGQARRTVVRPFRNPGVEARRLPLRPVGADRGTLLLGGDVMRYLQVGLFTEGYNGHLLPKTIVLGARVKRQAKHPIFWWSRVGGAALWWS